MAAVAPLEKPGAETARRAEPAVPVEPAGVQSLHAQGEPGKTLGLSLRRGHGQLSRKVDGSIAVAALTPISETRRDVNQAPGRHFELLSDQGSLRRSRGGEREYSHVDQSRPRLSESRLPAVEGQADGRDKRRIHRRSHPQESSLKWPICRILAQSPKTIAALNGILYHRTVASLLTVRLSAGDKPSDCPAMLMAQQRGSEPLEESQLWEYGCSSDTEVRLFSIAHQPPESTPEILLR